MPALPDKSLVYGGLSGNNATTAKDMKGIKIMKLHHTKYKKNYRAYILDHITDKNGNKLNTEQEQIDRLFSRFYSEYEWNIDLHGKRRAMIEWLQGLAIPFACYNNEIIDLAIEMGSIDENPSDKLCERVIDNYFPFMANIILDMEKQIEREGI